MCFFPSYNRSRSRGRQDRSPSSGQFTGSRREHEHSRSPPSRWSTRSRSRSRSPLVRRYRRRIETTPELEPELGQDPEMDPLEIENAWFEYMMEDTNGLDDDDGVNPRVKMDFSCEVCNVSVSSMQALQTHFAGAKHQKKLRQGGLTTDLQDLHKDDMDPAVKEKIFRCMVCDVVLSGHEIKVHVIGPRHQKKSEDAGVEGEDAFVEVNSGTYQSSSSSTIKTYSTRNEHHCSLCGVTLHHWEIFQKHLQGKRHQKLLKWNEPDEEAKAETAGVQQFWCNICGIFCTNKDSLDGHLAGKKHYKMLKSKGIPLPTAETKENSLSSSSHGHSLALQLTTKLLRDSRVTIHKRKSRSRSRERPRSTSGTGNSHERRRSHSRSRSPAVTTSRDNRWRSHSRSRSPVTTTSRDNRWRSRSRSPAITTRRRSRSRSPTITTRRRSRSRSPAITTRRRSRSRSRSPVTTTSRERRRSRSRSPTTASHERRSRSPSPLAVSSHEKQKTHSPGTTTTSREKRKSRSGSPKHSKSKHRSHRGHKERKHSHSEKKHSHKSSRSRKKEPTPESPPSPGTPLTGEVNVSPEIPGESQIMERERKIRSRKEKAEYDTHRPSQGNLHRNSEVEEQPRGKAKESQSSGSQTESGDVDKGTPCQSPQREGSTTPPMPQTMAPVAQPQLMMIPQLPGAVPQPLQPGEAAHSQLMPQPQFAVQQSQLALALYQFAQQTSTMAMFGQNFQQMTPMTFAVQPTVQGTGGSPSQMFPQMALYQNPLNYAPSQQQTTAAGGIGLPQSQTPGHLQPAVVPQMAPQVMPGPQMAAGRGGGGQPQLMSLQQGQITSMSQTQQSLPTVAMSQPQMPMMMATTQQPTPAAAAMPQPLPALAPAQPMPAMAMSQPMPAMSQAMSSSSLQPASQVMVSPTVAVPPHISPLPAPQFPTSSQPVTVPPQGALNQQDQEATRAALEEEMEEETPSTPLMDERVPPEPESQLADKTPPREPSAQRSVAHSRKKVAQPSSSQSDSKRRRDKPVAKVRVEEIRCKLCKKKFPADKTQKHLITMEHIKAVIKNPGIRIHEILIKV